MASTSAVSMAMPLANATQKKKAIPGNDAFLKPLPLRSSRQAAAPSSLPARFQVRASLKEKAVAGLTAVALSTSMVVPEVAMAASDLSPSLKNFLLSIAAGGVVLAAILGAIIGVSNFDPVKRT
ncbi:hypothetical protein MLD38_006937 [Melastoma candidum]|uniref:Uncharacterized protein n=1 Tax=Melastoma candidum TaxID=119954 RepID=A0ACB9RPI4_9MYRT|nr:hypothetical protein MLD38_006937 [Melastoma candidum]